MIIIYLDFLQVVIIQKMNEFGKIYYDVTLADEGWHGVQSQYPGTNTVILLK